MNQRLLVVAISALLVVSGCGPAGNKKDGGTGGGFGNVGGGFVGPGGGSGGGGGGATGGGGGGSTGGGGGSTTGGGGGGSTIGGGGGSTTGGGGGSTTGGGGGSTVPVLLDFDAGVSLWDGGAIVQAGQLTWTAEATDFVAQGENGTRISGDCPPGTASNFDSVWGTGFYTDDSSLCTIAVHYGLWDVTSGGQIIVELRPGEPSYAPSTNNGVTTFSYGAWTGSVVVVP